MSEAAIKQVITYLEIDPSYLILEDEKGGNNSEPDGTYLTQNEMIAIEHTEFDPKDSSGFNSVRLRQVAYNKLQDEIKIILMPLLNGLPFALNIELHPTLHYFSEGNATRKPDIKKMHEWRKRALDIIYSEVSTWLPTISPTKAGIKSSWTRVHPVEQPSDWLLPPQIKDNVLVMNDENPKFLTHMWHSYRCEAAGIHSFLSPHLFYHITLQPSKMPLIWMNKKIVWSGPKPDFKEVDTAIMKKSKKIPKYAAFLAAERNRACTGAWLVPE